MDHSVRFRVPLLPANDSVLPVTRVRALERDAIRVTTAGRATSQRPENIMVHGAEVALVTGVSRAEGLGFEVCRQLAARGLRVIVTARDEARAREAAASIEAEGGCAEARGLDITSDTSVQTLASSLARLDVLVNNAGGHFDFEVPTVDASIDSVRAALETNLLGAWRLTRALLPQLRASGWARIVNVSSEAGSFGSGHGMPARGDTLAAYGVSKAALNAFTVKLAAALGSVARVNAVCPGFVATYPGTAEMGARPVRDGAAGIVWAAMLPLDGPSGGFFRDGKPLAW
jgi:NAD(P)-dependent dehydrogenase (short-subunit alcohol dehydrogenase family)